MQVDADDRVAALGDVTLLLISPGHEHVTTQLALLRKNGRMRVRGSITFALHRGKPSLMIHAPRGEVQGQYRQLDVARHVNGPKSA
jgi:hypothetical protein